MSFQQYCWPLPLTCDLWTSTSTSNGCDQYVRLYISTNQSLMGLPYHDSSKHRQDKWPIKEDIMDLHNYRALDQYHSAVHDTSQSGAIYRKWRRKSSTIMSNMLFKSLTLCYEGTLQDYPAFLVTLIVFCGKLIDPSQLGITVLTGHVTDHVSSGQHHTVLYLTVVQVYNFVEQESSSSCTCESCRYEFCPVGKGCVTASTRK